MRKKRVLVVEDEQIIQRLCGRILSKRGIDVFLASNVDEGISSLQQREYDLLISDLKLPGGSGMDVVRSFHRRFPDKKVIIMTGSLTPEQELRDSGNLGISKCLIKPFDIEEFAGDVERALRT